MTLLLRPVTKMKCSMPAWRASSTTCWITGRSTTGSISFGMAFVAGRNRVPRPATGKTALRIGFMTSPRLSVSLIQLDELQWAGQDTWVGRSLTVLQPYMFPTGRRDLSRAKQRANREGQIVTIDTMAEFGCRGSHFDRPRARPRLRHPQPVFTQPDHRLGPAG